VRKLWGREIWHHNSEHYCMKTLILKSGYMSSLHMHKIKRETFLIQQGMVSLQVGSRALLMRAGDSFTIRPGIYHRFMSLTATSRVIEASTTHHDEDVYRKEDSRKVENGRSQQSRKATKE
jgi:mannose-6-phosphate isomerase-like protein (cupin superfamily)